MNKLTIVLSGKKQSGKTSSCNYILARYYNLLDGRDNKFNIDQFGNLRYGDIDFNQSVHGNLIIEGNLKRQGYEAKIYSFADPLKKFLIDVFGVPYEGCYGTDEQKNTPIPHLLWENIPRIWRPITKQTVYRDHYVEFSGMIGEALREPPEFKSGPMTGREMMQIFGSNIVRQIYYDAWAKGTYNLIKRDGCELALISDCRYPNEISCGRELKNIKFVRLLRNIQNDSHISETALDDYPLENYDLVIDNSNMSLNQQTEYLNPYIDKWFSEAKIAN